MNMFKVIVLLILSLVLNGSASAANSSNMSPLNKVSKIGDYLIQTTPFAYQLSLIKDSHVFNGLKTVDFSRSFGPCQNAMAYAYTTMQVEKDTTILVEIGHSGPCKMWCNSNLVYSSDDTLEDKIRIGERSVILPRHLYLNLHKGQNQIFIRLISHSSKMFVMLQPPSDNDAVIAKKQVEVKMGLKGVHNVSDEVADASDWLIIGPFNKDVDNVLEQEKVLNFGKMYVGMNGLITWTVPKREVAGTMINPAPWGTAYQWNYHNGGTAWAMAVLSQKTNNEKYRQWANRFCDFQIEGIPFVDYQVNTLHQYHSANNGILDCPLLDFTLAPSLPFIYRLRTDKSFPNRSEYESFIDRMVKYAQYGQIRTPGKTNYVRETPEKYTVWVDDMFMGIPFLVQASQYVNDPQKKKELLDDAAQQIVDFNKSVWDEQSQLYMHANFTSSPKVKLPHWSRANGWAIWAMSEVLLVLPKSHTLYRPILSQFKRTIQSLVRYQDEKGFWRNVIDVKESTEETSGTAIFVMAIARGIIHGWLDKTVYLPIVKKGWNAVDSQIDENGTVHGICVGTMCSTDVNYYINRPLYDNDTHGTFAIIFAGIEMQMLLEYIGETSADTRFTKPHYTKEDIVYLKRDLEAKHPYYDEKMHMLKTKTTGRHYHSDLDSGVIVHQTRESLEYALALLKTNEKKLINRGIDIIRSVLPLQETNNSEPYCGVWPYYPEDPLKGRKAPVDYNWADFIAVPLIEAIVYHHNLLDQTLQDDIKQRLILAAYSIKRRDVQPDYTNICIMGDYVCYVVGDIYHIDELKDYAKKRLRHFYNYTKATKGFTEYNSPTYTVVAMNELLRLKQCVINPEDSSLVNELYTMAWEQIGRHFHGPSGQWCGPNLRSYSNLATAETYRLFYNASDGAINLPGNYLKIPNIINPHQIPSNILHYFKQVQYPVLRVDTFRAALLDEKVACYPDVGSTSGDSIPVSDIIGKIYMTPSYAFASVNCSYMWNQTRPLIAHWGSPLSPSYLRVRFLKDNYDFSAVNIFCAQDSTDVLAIMNVSRDGGISHPSIDRIQNAKFQTSDLRLRIELGGNTNDTEILLPDSVNGVVHIRTNGMVFQVSVPYSEFGEMNGFWKVGDNGREKFIDYIIYHGPNVVIDLTSHTEFVLGFCLSTGTGSHQDSGRVSLISDESYLTLKNKDMMVKALKYCTFENIMRNDFSVKY